MDPDQLTRLIACLESLREQPVILHDRIGPDGVPAYFLGFAFALRFALGIETDFERERQLRWEATKRRGWQITEHPSVQMAQKGLTSIQALAELAEIEMEFIRLVRDNRGTSASSTDR